MTCAEVPFLSFAGFLSGSEKWFRFREDFARGALWRTVTSNLIDKDICLRRLLTQTKSTIGHRISSDSHGSVQNVEEEMEFGDTYWSAHVIYNDRTKPSIEREKERERGKERGRERERERDRRRFSRTYACKSDCTRLTRVACDWIMCFWKILIS